MKFKIEYIEVLAFFSLAAVLAFIATGAGSGPIGTSLSIRTSDIMSFLVVNSNPDIFAGSIVGEVAGVVTNSVPFNWLLSHYFSDGRVPEYARVCLYFLRILFYCFFCMVLGRAATGRFAGGLVALVLIVFSIETTLMPSRIISSTIASTFALAALAACFYGRFTLASAIAGITVCIHPTFGMFLMSIIIASNFAVNMMASRKRFGESIRPMTLSLGVFLLLAAPFFVMSAIEITTRLNQSLPDQGIWWSFVPTINSLAFPLMRGIANIISYILIFILSGVLVLAAAPKDKRSVVIVTTMGVCVLAYMVQATFTSAIKSQLVAQLALNHRANAIAMPLVYVAILLALSKSVRKFDTMWLAWFSLILAIVYSDGWGISKADQPMARITALVSTDFIQADTVMALAIAVLLVYSSRINRKNLVAVGWLVVVLFCGWALNNEDLYFYLVPLLLWYLGEVVYPVILRIFLTLRKDIVFQRVGLWRAFLIDRWVDMLAFFRKQSTNPVELFLKKFNVKLIRFVGVAQKTLSIVYGKMPKAADISPLWVLLMALACILGRGLAMNMPPYSDSLSAWHRLAKGEMLNSWAKHFLDKYVPASEHVIIMPLRGPGVWLTTTPWRRAYLDPVDGHYLLYQPSYLNEYLRRLKPYSGGGEQPNEWFLDTNIWRHLTGIRSGISSIQKIDEKARWILTFDKFLCGKDVVHAVYDGYGSGPPGHLGKVVLIKIDNFDTTCSCNEDTLKED